MEPILGEQDFEVYIGATRTNQEVGFSPTFGRMAIYDKALTAPGRRYYQAAFPAIIPRRKADNLKIYWRFEGMHDEWQQLCFPAACSSGWVGRRAQQLFGRVSSNEAGILYNLEDYSYELC